MEKITYLGLLQPLSIPKITWKDKAMDFIEILLKSWRNDTITVIVYKFTKYGHFITLAHTLIYILKGSSDIRGSFLQISWIGNNYCHI
jgi:hypothetical protein